MGSGSYGQSINVELGYSPTTQITLNTDVVRALAGIMSGQISLSSFYGKTALRIDASSSAGTSSLYGNTGGSWSHTCTGTSTTGMLIVHVGVYNSEISSVTYANISMSQIASSSYPATPPAAYGNFLYYLPNPPTGSNNITVTYAGTGYGSAAAISFVSASRGIGAIVSASAPSANNKATTTITPTATSSIVIAGVITTGDEGSGTATPGTNQIEIYNNRTGNVNLHAASRTAITSTSAISQSWSLPGNGGWSIGAAEVLVDTGAPAGQQIYTASGTYTFVVPTGVTSISAVCVGGGQGGAGCAGSGSYLSYANNISVTPGASLQVVVGAGGSGLLSNITYGTSGGDSKITGSSTIYVLAPGGGSTTATVGTAYRGGTNTGTNAGGGGGAGGYSGVGGNGGYEGSATASTAGTGGAGGGGGGGPAFSKPTARQYGGAGGGGVGLNGIGPNGTAGETGTPTGGGGGSGGTTGSANFNSTVGGDGGLYGGGGGGGGYVDTLKDTRYSAGGSGGVGGVRIIWGTGRSYPKVALSA